MSFVKPITGPSVTSGVGMELADLGIARWDTDRNANAVMFGDNFAYGWGDAWQSPSIVMYDNAYNVLGIPTADGIEMAPRRQIIDYPHNNPEFSTILPCDFIRIDGTWYVAAMVTKGLGNELRTVFWQSVDLVSWVKTEPYVSLNHPGHPGNVMLSFDRNPGDEWVYIFGTGGLARDRGVWMWRVEAATFPHGYWQPWGLRPTGKWDWNWPNEATPLLEGRHGELCFRFIQGNAVLSYFDVDAYRQTALTVQYPTDDWTTANRCDYAHGESFHQLYGGYITPGSRLSEQNGMEFLVSQWNTQTNWPYHVCLFVDTLQAKGPLIIPSEPSQPEPKPEPEPEVDVPVTDSPQELYDLLIKELAASGSTPITTADGRKLTLREAVGEIYLQQCLPDTLKGTPTDPRHAVDQFDHVRSARSEGLFTQTVTIAIADHLGIDVDKLYRQVRRSIG